MRNTRGIGDLVNNHWIGSFVTLVRSFIKLICRQFFINNKSKEFIACPLEICLSVVFRFYDSDVGYVFIVAYRNDEASGVWKEYSVIEILGDKVDFTTC